jgi:hypothetical protein
MEDYDLFYALSFNPQDNGRIVYADGGCDYTGWDCQSSLSSQFVDSVEDALELVRKDYGEDWYNELAGHIANGKPLSWREKRDLEFSVNSVEAAKEAQPKSQAEVMAELRRWGKDAW